jgi:Ca2+-binding RTX toxin-like protein
VVRIIVLTCALFTAFVSVASASTVQLEKATITYQAGANEANDLSITYHPSQSDQPAEVVFQESAAANVLVTPQEPCRASTESAIATRTTVCPLDQVTSLNVRLADRDDQSNIEGYKFNKRTYFIPITTTVYGGVGDDTLSGGFYAGQEPQTARGTVRLYGEENNDTLFAGARGFFTLKGGIGNDLLVGDPGPHAGKTRQNGGAGADRLVGGSANDSLLGGSGNDHLYGGDGADKLFAKDGVRDRVNGGKGEDTGVLDVNIDVHRSLQVVNKPSAN